MSNLDYYKSLISDDEVINALVKESRARDGDVEKTRVRPNMNFFQRTVTHIVSSNRRITSRQEQKIAEEKKKYPRYRPRKVISKKKTAKELINEILNSQTKFVRSSNPEDFHFDHKKSEVHMNIEESECSDPTTDDKTSSVDPTNVRPKTVSSRKVKPQEPYDDLLISSDDDCISESTEIPALEKESVRMICDQPIQISSGSDEDDIKYSYRKKKCKRRHQHNKHKERLKT